MSYIGFKPVQGNVIVDEFTSVGGSTYTLSSAPSNITSVEVVVGGLTQTSSAYSFVGTTLTLAGVASGTKIIVRQHGETILVPTPANNTVTTASIAAGAVTAAKIDSAVELGGPSKGTSSVIRTNANTIAENITLDANTNGISAGTITIKSISKKYGAVIIDRPKRLCSNKALGEDVFRHGYFDQPYRPQYFRPLPAGDHRVGFPKKKSSLSD